MSAQKTYDVMICGYLCIDLVVDFRKTPVYQNIYDCLKPGKLTEVDSLSFTPGGMVGNTGMAARKFGHTVFLNAMVGDDPLSDILLSQINNFASMDGIRKTAGQGSAFGIVIAPPGVDRIFLEAPGSSMLFGPEHVDLTAAAQSRIFHFGYLPLLERFFENGGKEVVALLSAVTRLGTVTSMDLSLPDAKSKSGEQNWLNILKRIFPSLHILVPSVEELLYMLMPDVYQRIADACREADIVDHIPLETVQQLGKMALDMGVKIVMVKLAHRGIYLATSDVSELNTNGNLALAISQWNHGEWLCEAYAADEQLVTTASGAGDTAAAAFLAALLRQESPEKALKLAAMAGRNSLYCTNLYQELPTWTQMNEAIDNETIPVRRFEINNNRTYTS